MNNSETIETMEIVEGDSNQVTSESLNAGDIIAIAIPIIFIIFCIYMAYITSKARKIAKKQNKENLKIKNASFSITVPHLTGLSIPENTFTTIYVCQDKYEFDANGVTFSLNKDKITDISIKTDTEIQKQIVSSVGGAVGGAVLLGPLGAIIGGRAKQKNIKTITHCLIFTYLKDNQPNFIAFEVYSPYDKDIRNLITDFQTTKDKNVNNKIEL